MVSMTIEYGSLDGTGASIGCAGNHTLIADRPPGKAGGLGLGFNGGELLALAIGGCFCNDVHYCAHELGLEVSRLRVKVTIEFDGDPLLATRSVLGATCELLDGTSPDEVLSRARARSAVANSLRAGVPVLFE